MHPVLEWHWVSSQRSKWQDQLAFEQLMYIGLTLMAACLQQSFHLLLSRIPETGLSLIWASPCFMPRPSGRAVADEGWWPGNARYIQAKVNSLISGTILFRHSRNPCFPHWKIKQNHWNRNIRPQNKSKSHAYFFLTNQIKQNKNPQIQEVKGREKPGEISMVPDICDIISASLSIMDLSP